MRFDPSFLDEIRARLPVSQVVAKRVKLKRQGREFVGLSPFKQEKTPSFTVNDRKGFYHCFASGEHGDIFTFLQKTEGLSFPEAVEQLAAEAGLEMPKPTPGAEARERHHDRLRAAMEAACAFFEDALQGQAGRAARDYLAARGVSGEAQGQFRLGFAPNGRYALKEHLAGKGFTQEEMAEAGLIIAGEDIAVSYDRFRGRIVFPIRDLRGRVIAFGGRALSPDAQAKYLNSPETPLFHKGAVLFNAQAAREAAHTRGQVLVVEGYMDVIALSAAGFPNAVAPLGTALTENQLQLLWRMAEEPVLCFDGDEAGTRAAHRAVDTALPHLTPGASLAFAFLPEGQDPDDLLRAEGADAFRAVVEGASPLVELLWRRETEGGRFDTPERRAALEDRLAGLLRRIGDRRVRRHYGQQIAERLSRLWAQTRPRAEPARGGGESWMARRRGPGPGLPSGARQGSRGRFPAPVGASESLKRSGLVRGTGAVNTREAVLLLTLLNHPWLFETHAEEIAAVRFQSRRLEGLRDAMLNLQAGDKPLDTNELRTQLKETDNGAIVAQVERAVTHKSDWFAQPGASREDVEAGWRQVLALHRRAVELGRELEAAQKAYEDEGTEAAFERLCAIREQLSNLDGIEAAVEGYGAESGRAAGPLS